MNDFAEFGLAVPDILLPKDMDVPTWSVIACDQYTQDASYWNAVEAAVQGKPSTLRLILPEIHLDAPDRAGRIARIKETMRGYLDGGTFAPALSAFVYVERTTAYGRTRKGLVAALDLDAYEWKPFSTALVRATEATIVERIPPRKEIRSGAPLESPHIMLLANDPQGLLIEACGARAKQARPLYDGELMLKSGHVTGWAVQGEEEHALIRKALSCLRNGAAAPDGSSFLFAVGDGNHSLATAKAVWEEHKAALLASGQSPEQVQQSPVRYALVEIVSIYDAGLTFEPIHRVLFNVRAADVRDAVRGALGGSVTACADATELEARVKGSTASFGFVHIQDGRAVYECLDTPVQELAVSRLQPALDDYIARCPESARPTIDYIHGSDEVFRLGKESGALTILLPPIAKDSFFATIQSRGPLPRKSFSMGEASEKRFYLECRRLFPVQE